MPKIFKKLEFGKSYRHQETVNAAPPYKISFKTQSGKSFEADICYFCENQSDFTGDVKCEYYDMLHGIHCPLFQAATDQKKRFSDIVKAQSAKETAYEHIGGSLTDVDLNF